MWKFMCDCGAAAPKKTTAGVPLGIMGSMAKSVWWGRSNENKMECRRMSGRPRGTATAAGDEKSWTALDKVCFFLYFHSSLWVEILSVHHHFEISNLGPSNHPRMAWDSTYHMLLARGWCRVLCRVECCASVDNSLLYFLIWLCNTHVCVKVNCSFYCSWPLHKFV